MFPPRHAAGAGRRAMRMAVVTADRDRNATPMSLALLAVCFAALSASRALRHATKARAMPHCTSSSTLSSLRRQCLMRDHPLTSSSTPHPRTLSTTSSRPQCVTRCHGGTHRPSEAHTPERSRVRRQSGGGRLPNHRPKRSTTTNKPLRRRSARMAMQARLHTRQRRRPRDHRHGPSARQDHHPNTNIHPASNPANHACSTTTLRWPPPRAAHQSLFRRKDGGTLDGGTLGWSTSRRPSANARGSASGKMTAVRRERARRG